MNNTIFLEHIPLVSTIWFSSDSKITRYGPTRRNVYIIHYVLSGKGYFNGNEVKAGQGFLIRPNELEHYYPDEKDPWKYIWIISKDENMEYFFTQHNANPKTQIFAFKNTYALENVITILASSKNVLKYSTTHLTEYFLNIYKNILKDGAEIHQKTDNIHFFEFSLEQFSNSGFAFKNISLDLHNSGFEGNIMTEYEQKFVSQGLPIYRLEAYMK